MFETIKVRLSYDEMLDIDGLLLAKAVNTVDCCGRLLHVARFKRQTYLDSQSPHSTSNPSRTGVRPTLQQRAWNIHHEDMVSTSELFV